MQEAFELIDTFLFSGKFPLVFPATIKDSLRAILVDVEVVRFPTNFYESRNTNPFTSFYATMISHQRDMPMQRYDVLYPTQRYLFTGHDDEQILPAMYCYHFATIRTIINLALGLGVILAPISETIVQRPLRSFLDELKFVCHADTALRVSLYKLKFDECDNYPDSAIPTPPKPSNPISFPQGAPILPVDGYSPNGGLPEDYEPYPGDNEGVDPGDFPQGLECEAIALRWNTFSETEQLAPIDRVVFGVVNGQRIAGTPGNFEVFVTCQGDNTTGCIPVQELNLFSFTGFAIEYVGVI